MNWAAKTAALTWMVLAVTPPFQILTAHLPPPRRGQPYKAQLQAEGGTKPYTWSIVHGQLPAGLEFNGQSGRITGTPASAGSFALLIAVRDASQPPLEETRLLPASKSAPLAISWTQPPRVSGENLGGAIEVRNESGQTVRLTVIAVAVNGEHKAFTLRYAHQQLSDKESTGTLPFSVFLPPGEYTVNVDAVAEVSKDVIYRQRLEVPGLTVPGS
ncbi:MAG: putative Ig domain-containing protein [Terriglobales bacterium]